mmetsp:Transcript_26447/g.66735  ORF Transcript_26447/g.66735 Transcript_26447/m.66735 type:complete len:337 (+) Transcript_26447:102-1112(+)
MVPSSPKAAENNLAIQKFRDLLSQQTAGDLPKDKEPLTVSAGTPPVNAFTYLSHQGIRACPVVNDENKIIGTLDLRDSCGLICHMYSESLDKAAAKPTLERSGSMDIIKPGDNDISAVCAKRPFVTFPPSASLLEVATALATGSHIVGITGGAEANGGLSRIVTQGILLNFIAPEFENFRMPVKTCMSQPVVSMLITEPALKGFELMASRGVSCIAVCDDEEGHVIFNVSASDARTYFGSSEQEPLTDLSMDVGDYMVEKQQQASSAKTRAPITVCKEEDDLNGVVTKLVKTGYHRIWVVRDKKPVGLLSLTDVFKHLVIPEGQGEGGDDGDCCIL